MFLGRVTVGRGEDLDDWSEVHLVTTDEWLRVSWMAAAGDWLEVRWVAAEGDWLLVCWLAGKGDWLEVRWVEEAKIGSFWPKISVSSSF